MLFHKRVRNCLPSSKKVFFFFFCRWEECWRLFTLPTFNSEVHGIIFCHQIKISGIQHTAIDCFIFFCDRMKGEDDLTIRGIAFATSNYSSIVCWWAWNLYCGWFCYLQKYCHKIFVCFIPYSPWNPSNITRKMPTEVERGVNQSNHSLITIFWYKLDLGSCYKSKLKEWLSTNSGNRSHVNYVLVHTYIHTYCSLTVVKKLLFRTFWPRTRGRPRDFLVGVPNFGSDRTVELFCGK